MAINLKYKYSVRFLKFTFLSNANVWFYINTKQIHRRWTKPNAWKDYFSICKETCRKIIVFVTNRIWSGFRYDNVMLYVYMYVIFQCYMQCQTSFTLVLQRLSPIYTFVGQWTMCETCLHVIKWISLFFSSYEYTTK